MNVLFRHSKVIITLSVLSLIVQLAGAAGVTTWSGGGADQNWSTVNNWTTVGGSRPPASGDSVIFRSTGTAAAAGTVDNNVDSNVTIASLFFTNDVANVYHTTQIPTGNTLTVNGPIFIGSNNVSSTYSLTGGGTLRGGNGTSLFSLACQNGGSLTNDLSGLSNFIWNSGGAGSSFLVTLDASVSSSGYMKLAAVSNNITATTMTVGQNNSSGTAVMNLGAGTNLLNVNTLQVSMDKVNGTVNFLSGTGGLRVRNAAGTGRTTVTVCANGHTGSSGATTTGNIFLKGHPVDMQISTLTLANRAARSGGSDNAFFSFDAGTVDCTAINMAINTSGGTAPVGMMSVGGGTLKAGSISLVNCGGTGGTGSLIVTNGGTASAGSIVKTTTTGTGIISVTNSTLMLNSGSGSIGSASVPIDTLNLNGAALHLALDANNIANTYIVVTTINTNGVNAITIDSIANASGAMTFNLIGYTGTDPFSSFTTLTLPAGYTGNLVDSGGVVQLNVNAPVATALVWVGATNSIPISNWDTNRTKNWLDQATLSIAQSYADPDAVLFDDTAANGTVTLLTTNQPSSITFNNSTLNYTINGGGRISGTATMTKQGTAKLTLADFGADNFSGGFNITGGTVVFDSTNSVISGGLTNAFGTTVQVGNNDSGGALPAGTIDDEGSLIFQRVDNVSLPGGVVGAGSLTQNGNGTLTLSGAQSYTGATVASKGKLVLSVGNAVQAGTGLLVSNATLDVSALTGPVTLNDFSVTNATINLVALASLAPAIGVNSFESDGTIGVSNIINVASLPAVAVYPATLTLIKSTNAIYLAGGNFNFALGTLPAGSTGYVTNSSDGTSVLLTLTSGPVGTRTTANWVGILNTTTTTNWSDGLNWQLPGAPGAADNVVFGNTGLGPDTMTINNVVDTSVTVSSLTYGQNNNSQYHVTEIPAGNTLTVSGNVTVGNLPVADGTITATYLAGGGMFVANGGTFTVNNFGSSSSGSLATLNMTNLAYFIYNGAAGTMNVASAAANNRFGGLLQLAGVSNNVTAGTINLQAANLSNGGNGSSGFQFGPGTNIVNVGQINVADNKSSSTMRFVSSAPPSAGLRLRGVNGNTDDTSRANITLAGRVSTGTGTDTGNLTLAGFPVDLKVGTLILGENTQSGGNTAVGVLSYDTGTLDVNTVIMGHSGNTAALATGSLAVGSTTATAPATLIVGSGGISLVNQASGTATGILGITNATVISSNNIIKTTTGGTASVSLQDSSLTMIAGTLGTLAAPIDNLTLTDSGSSLNKIQLNVTVGVTNICATAVNIGGGMTTINISSLAGVIGTAQIPLISYTGTSPMSGLTLGSTPAGYTSASLVDSGTTIDLLITAPAPTVWRGTPSTTWATNIPTLNWLNGATPVAYADIDFVRFDDTASIPVAAISGTVSPASLDVSNILQNYTFNGTGKISGNVVLIKQGSGNLVLDNSGSNNFTGGINIIGGTLQSGNNDTGGNLPVVGAITDDGTLVFNRTDSNSVPNLISGSGAVTQSGTGTNKLTALSTYSGNTVISSGMIIANSASNGVSSIGSFAGACYITNGGTLDIENPTANLLSFTNLTDSAGKQFYIAGAGVGGAGAIVNNGTVNQQNAIQNLTLTANATIGGPARWDMRVSDGKFQPIMDLGGFTLTKSGTNQMSMVALIVTNGGHIVINAGTLSFETLSSNSTAPITVNAGGVLGHFRENATLFTAPLTLNGGMIRDLNGTPGSTNDEPITLTANSFLDLNVGSSDNVCLNGTIAESGGSFGLTKTNGGSYMFTSAETYSGTTLLVSGRLILNGNGSINNSKTITVNSGATFDASQRSDQTLTLNAGQTLNGSGAVTGLVNAVTGSTIAPGSPSSIGTLSFGNNVTLGGTNLVKLNRGASPSNDVQTVAGNLTYGGTLTVQNLGGSYAPGDTFKLFNVTGTISGSFSATNFPSLGGGLGLTWNPATATLTVVQTVNTTPTNITTVFNGSTLTLSWPADHTGWRLQVQTNTLGVGLNPASWTTVPGSTSVNSIIVTPDPTKGTVFYRMVYP